MHAAAVAAVFSVLFALAMAGPAASAPPGLCLIDVTLSPPEKEAAVTSTQPAAVVFNGNYTVDFPAFERGAVTLTATVDTGWVATVSPASIEVTNIRTGPFTVTVVAPAGSFPDPPGIVVVTGRLVAGGIQCTDQTDGNYVRPRPYFDSFLARASPEDLALTKGGGSISVAMSASASVLVTVDFEFDGPDGMEFRGPARLTLPAPGAGPMNATAKFTVSAPGLSPGSYEARVLVKASTADGLTHDQAPTARVTVPASSPLEAATPWVAVGGVAAACAAAFLWWRRRS